MIAMLIIKRTRYSPEAMRTFWRRVEHDENLSEKSKRLRRDLSPRERTQIIEELLLETPTETEAHVPNDMQSSQRDFNVVKHRIP